MKQQTKPPTSYAGAARQFRKESQRFKQTLTTAINVMEQLAMRYGRYAAYSQYAQMAVKNIDRLNDWILPEAKADIELLAWPVRNLFEIFLFVNWIDDKKENWAEFKEYGWVGLVNVAKETSDFWQRELDKTGEKETTFIAFHNQTKSEAIKRGYKNFKLQEPGLLKKCRDIEPTAQAARETFYKLSSKYVHPSPLQALHQDESFIQAYRAQLLLCGFNFAESLQGLYRTITKRIQAGTHFTE